jgi:hypothetical protein
MCTTLPQMHRAHNLLPSRCSSCHWNPNASGYLGALRPRQQWQWHCSDLARALGHTQRPRCPPPVCSLVSLVSLVWLCLARRIIFIRSAVGLLWWLPCFACRIIQPLPAAGPLVLNPAAAPPSYCIADACALYVELTGFGIDDDARSAVLDLEAAWC